MHHERNIRLRERRHCCFGNDVFARLEGFAGESAEQKAKGLRLRFFVGEGDDDHMQLLEKYGNHSIESTGPMK
jgi:hypothetical protein